MRCSVRNIIGRFFAFFGLIAGLGQLIVGWTHIGERFNQNWCKAVNDAGGYVDNACVGNLLSWNDGDVGFTKDVNGPPFDSGNNYKWRDVFTFLPDLFVDFWTPMIFGIISVCAHVGHTRWNLITDNWMRYAIWSVLQACWGSIGYAGNLGVIVGLANFGVAFFCILGICIAPDNEPVLNLSIAFGLAKHAVSPREGMEMT